MTRDIPLVQFEIFKPYDRLHHGFSTKWGGVSVGSYGEMNPGVFTKDNIEDVEENLYRFLNRIDLDDRSVMVTRQIHSDRVAVIGERLENQEPWTVIDQMDGMVTSRTDVALVTFYADCVPLFIYDPVQHVGGVIHAGWKGTAAKIAQAAVGQLMSAYGSVPETIRVGIGPSAGSCCYEVDEPVKAAFEGWTNPHRWLQPKGHGKYNIDLKILNKEVFMAAGILEQNIEIIDHCTQCHGDYHSYRKTGSGAGRMVAVMGLE